MMRIKCYGCGLETNDKGFFVSDSWISTPNRGVTLGFWCPQCTSAQPKLGPAYPDPDLPSPWPEPKWEVVETAQGVCVRQHSEGGGTFTSQMVKGHHLIDQPATLLNPEAAGSIADYHKVLVKRSEARSAAFKAAVEAWEVAHPEPRQRISHEYVDWVEAKREAMDALRKEHKVGPHFVEVTYDGPALTRRALRLRRVA